MIIMKQFIYKKKNTTSKSFNYKKSQTRKVNINNPIIIKDIEPVIKIFEKDLLVI